jgi:hypothetical protein
MNIFVSTSGKSCLMYGESNVGLKEHNIAMHHKSKHKVQKLCWCFEMRKSDGL